MLPSPDILNEYEHGKFVLSNLAAKRAKQLREGAPPLVRIDSNHPLTIALAEIAAGKIKPLMNEAAVPAIEPEEEGVLVDTDFGMLLPALDETEAALVTSVVGALGEEEVDHEHEHEEPDLLSLSDLVGGEEEEEVAAPAGEEETLSLTDIAEEETHLEEEEPEE